ncbi:MAG: hypothetical protein LBK06_06460 [Planctomycetaceae bacterium]|nr:hypothetical protein [Planctomycetaceae bacterium]
MYILSSFMTFSPFGDFLIVNYAEAVLKFAKLNTAAQQRGAVVQGRSLSPYRLWYKKKYISVD